jgi:hypothetical protein
VGSKDDLDPIFASCLAKARPSKRFTGLFFWQIGGVQPRGCPCHLDDALLGLTQEADRSRKRCLQRRSWDAFSEPVRLRVKALYLSPMAGG